ncbi:MAG: hypothetical protein NVS3B17_09610 [Vulcanimicrobiaceae bacterium]
MFESDDLPRPTPSIATAAVRAADVERRLRHAKRPESPIAGPYGHPLHPALVAVPIGAWVTSFVFDVRSSFAKQGRDDARASRDAMTVGIAGALAAAVLGYLDWRRLAPGTKAKQYGTAHMVLNLAILAFYVDAVRRRSTLAGMDDASAHVSLGTLAAHGAALGVLSFSGVIGGELAYRFGVRVADETTQRSGFEAERLA